MRYIVVLFLLLFTSCVSKDSTENDRIIHTVMAYHSAAKVVVKDVKKVEQDAHISLVINYESTHPVTANVYHASTRRGFDLGKVLAYDLRSHSSDQVKQIVFKQHMRNFPDTGVVVVELCVDVSDIPAPVSSVWIVFCWDRIYLWDHQEATRPTAASYAEGKGFYKWAGDTWEPSDPSAVLKGALVLSKKHK